MCFLLYLGTQRPLPRRDWNKETLNLSVVSLTEREFSVKAHFSTPEVQYVGSSSNCGCDFPHATLQNGDWPTLDLPPELLDRDAARAATELDNKRALIDLLLSSGENSLEMYGILVGDFALPPQAVESISIANIRAAGFTFKERCFYKVVLDSVNEPN